MNEIPIPVYAINLKSRNDRKQHIIQQFQHKEEFDLHIVDACTHIIGAVGLWKSINYILQKVVDDQNECIIVCEDDHQFTCDYKKEYLFECIGHAKENEADILLGGVSWFTSMIEVTQELFWVEKFNGAQFTILFRKFFKNILEADFDNNNCADLMMGSLTEKKFFMHPFISIQKDFGYSDVTPNNNASGRVCELFENSVETISILNKVKEYYQKNNKNIQINHNSYNTITIPTYIINLPARTERRVHIEKQFAGRNEFDVTLVEAVKHKIGAVGLWLSIRKVIEMAIENEDDIIIISEDDHEFTENYSKYYLIGNIIGGAYQGVELLTGGIAHFEHAVPISENRLWIDSFWCTQFIIVYKSLFKKILEEPFKEDDTADGKLSEMTSHKMTLSPFISNQRNFGYSDVTTINQMQSDFLDNGFAESEKRLEKILKVKKNYSMSDSG